MSKRKPARRNTFTDVFMVGLKLSKTIRHFRLRRLLGMNIDVKFLLKSSANETKNFEREKYEKLRNTILVCGIVRNQMYSD